MKTRTIRIRADEPLGSYAHELTRKTKNLRNVANYYIRNTMTGIRKPPEERTHNETEVLHDVFNGIQMANSNANRRIRNIIDVVKDTGIPSLEKHACIYKKISKVRYLPYPTAEKWMLSYGQMDAVLKFTQNRDYYALPSQVNQQALKKTLQSWKSYFKSLVKYKKDPSGYTGRPKLPGYIRSEKSTAHIPNQRIKETGTGTVRKIIVTRHRTGHGSWQRLYRTDRKVRDQTLLWRFPLLYHLWKNRKATGSSKGARADTWTGSGCRQFPYRGVQF